MKRIFLLLIILSSCSNQEVKPEIAEYYGTGNHIRISGRGAYEHYYLITKNDVGSFEFHYNSDPNFSPSGRKPIICPRSPISNCYRDKEITTFNLISTSYDERTEEITIAFSNEEVIVKKY